MNHFHKFLLIGFVLALLSPEPGIAQSQLDCSLCHSTVHGNWVLSHHADTQNDVAGELAEEWAGVPPDSVINGQEAEDCIACHSATSITANGGMTEVQTMDYFFSTTDGVFTDSTDALHTDEWQHNACIACHNVPEDHPATASVLAVFNSPTAQYLPVDNASMLCGQCHGTLRYPDTDHRRLDAWLISKHGHGGQADIAGELAEAFAGSTTEEVVADENCIACHAPTSVLLNGGISEAEALNALFTTEDGLITENTVPKNIESWPEVSCTACHNQHHPEAVSYFNSETKEYEEMNSVQDLCGMCHGNLRFPETDHLSYNIELGTGGMGIPDRQTMPGIQCVDCHMYAGEVDGSLAAMYAGHSWKVFVDGGDRGLTASCTVCHSSMTVFEAEETISAWQDDFAQLDAIAGLKVSKADSALANSTDSTLIKMLEEAEYNLAFVESDESGGVHNHLYTMALLQDAIDKSEQILSGIFDFTSPGNRLVLLQNYPNPFSETTNIEYKLPDQALVTIELFNFNGKKIGMLLENVEEPAGLHTVKLNAADLPNGIYFCSLKAGLSVRTIKMVLMH
ncbi:MAG: ammonia-forming cytochrome c nitrite reductase subunit c552 [Bacteroidales bacterium]|nr:ammonia-forming cytochrome c nitrite reductase subunit c552 [Bacteroidales bacterium]